jgi:hypothetical protein
VLILIRLHNILRFRYPWNLRKQMLAGKAISGYSRETREIHSRGIPDAHRHT